MRHLSRRYRVVPASGLLPAVRARRRGQRLPVAITFDDDLPSHVEVAAPILAEHGVPATFYLTGAGLEGPVRFWWERLEALWRADPDSRPALRARAGVSEDAALKTVGRTVEAWPPEGRAAFDAALRQAAGPDPPDSGLRAAQVRVLAAAGHEIGFHTLRHDRLTTLSAVQLRDALRDGMSALEAAGGASLRTVAYPHGQADADVAAAAGAAGYAAGFTTHAAPVSPHGDPLLAGRYWPTYGSAHHFAVEVAQLLAGRWGEGGRVERG